MQPMNENWTMTTANSTNTETYLFVWTADGDMPDQLLQACRQLQTDPPQWPGSQIRFEESPEPGFLIDIAKEWKPASTLEEEALFNKLMWEIERAKGKT